MLYYILLIWNLVIWRARILSLFLNTYMSTILLVKIIHNLENKVHLEESITKGQHYGVFSQTGYLRLF
jgi:hypothetical protein